MTNSIFNISEFITVRDVKIYSFFVCISDSILEKHTHYLFSNSHNQYERLLVVLKILKRLTK
jgi:hypothetical protein